MAEQTGTIKQISKQVISSKDGSKTFDKVTLILSYTTGQGEHTQDQSVPFIFFGKPAAAVNNFADGEEVKISYDLKGKEYNGKYYAEVSAWKIELIGEKKSSVGNGPVRNEPQPQTTQDSENLPF